MSKTIYGIVEHQSFHVADFKISDATATGPRAHDDLVWVGAVSGEGRWLTPDEALDLAKAITTVANSNLCRRGFCAR